MAVAGREILVAPRTARPALILAALAASTLPIALLQSLVSPALAELQDQFGTSQTATAWVLTGYLLALGMFTPIIGRIGDLFGKRRVLVAVLVVVCVGTALAAVATSLPVMVTARILQGAGGGLFPLGFGIVRDHLPRDRVAGAIGLLSAILGFGAGLGVALSGVIVDHVGYHFLFWLPLALLLGALVGVLVCVPESPRRAGAHVNWGAAALLSLGLTLFLLGITKVSSWGWLAAGTVGLVLGGLLVLVAWYRFEERSPHPLIDVALVRDRSIWATNVVAGLVNVGLFTCFVTVPQFALADPAGGYGFGASDAQAGLLLVPLCALMFVAGAAAGRLEHRYGSRPPLIAGCAIGVLAYVVLLAAHGSPAPVYLASGILGLGTGLAYSAATNVVVQAVRPDQTGEATGLLTVTRTVGGTVGSQLTATLLATSAAAGGALTVDGFEHTFLMAAIALALAVPFAWSLPRRAAPA